MTGISDRSQAEYFASLLPDPPPSDFDWVGLLEGPVTGAGFDTSDIRLVHTVQPPAFQLLGNAVEKWVVEYDEGWEVREWEGENDPFAEGDWNEQLDGDA